MVDEIKECWSLYIEYWAVMLTMGTKMSEIVQELDWVGFRRISNIILRVRDNIEVFDIFRNTQKIILIIWVLIR